MHQVAQRCCPNTPPRYLGPPVLRSCMHGCVCLCVAQALAEAGPSGELARVSGSLTSPASKRARTLGRGLEDLECILCMKLLYEVSSGATHAAFARQAAQRRAEQRRSALRRTACSQQRCRPAAGGRRPVDPSFRV